MTAGFVCIHGHFYQPPRENPWLEEVEREESARPFHDWNERICHEAYSPNAFSRILDGEDRIIRIVNNYARMSFNFGPTLLSWMARRAPETYRSILEADRLSMRRFSGHGSALAQAYGHVILPLASSRDKATQIRWGVRDFQSRFGRDPEGMWLPETAVDLESLELMASEGLRFTVLAPRQARAVRPIGRTEWDDVSGERVDTSRPYRVRLPSGAAITVFFYDGPLSRAVAFERILADGGNLAGRLMESARLASGAAPLAHIATDGETFGHHHSHGEMALSYAFHVLESDPGIRLTNYAEYLSLHPPTHEVQLHEGSSWSCEHGVERWRSDCGCTTGGQVGGRQGWRRPLREALDWLRDELAVRFQDAAEGILRDPWGARDRYIEVILDRESARVGRFLTDEAARTLGPEEKVRALRLLELQRQAMLMYTSCGWFFDDLARIETLQVLRYAARAIHLGEGLFGEAEASRIEEGFLERLEVAHSNVPAMGTGRDLYQTRIRPGRVDLAKVAAHHAVASLFEDGEGDERNVYCYTVRTGERREMSAGDARFAVGWLAVTSRITCDSERFSFAVLHLRDHHLVGGVRRHQGADAFEKLRREVVEEFERGRVLEMTRILDREFQASTYSLHSLFRDEQERVVTRILERSLEEAEGALAGLYESRVSLMRVLAELDMAQPPPFRAAGEFVLNVRLERALTRDDPDLSAAEEHFQAARSTGLRVDRRTLRHAAGAAVVRLLRRLAEEPDVPERLERVERVVAFVRSLPFPIDLWDAQNIFFQLVMAELPERRDRAAEGDPLAAAWVDRFRIVGEALSVAVADTPALA